MDCIGHSEQENYRYDYDLVTRRLLKTTRSWSSTALIQCPQGRYPQYAGAAGPHALPTAAAFSGQAMPTTYQLQHGLCALYAMLEEMQFRRS